MPPNIPISHRQPACPLELWTASRHGAKAKATPSPLSPHQPSLSSGALNCLRTRRLPRKSYSRAVSPAWVYALQQPTLTPSTQSALWSPNTAYATQHFYSHTIGLFLGRSAFLPNAGPATVNPPSRHQQSLFPGAPGWVCCVVAGSSWVRSGLAFERLLGHAVEEQCKAPGPQADDRSLGRSGPPTTLRQSLDKAPDKAPNNPPKRKYLSQNTLRKCRLRRRPRDRQKGAWRRDSAH